MKSIITDDMEHCYLCGSTEWIELHHCFGGSNRKWSTKYKLIIPLCHYCHNEPPNGVHHNAETMQKVHEIGQRTFERDHTREEFMRIFGRNWL